MGENFIANTIIGLEGILQNSRRFAHQPDQTVFPHTQGQMRNLNARNQTAMKGGFGPGSANPISNRDPTR